MYGAKERGRGVLHVVEADDLPAERRAVAGATTPRR
jgi:hypothetical protein